jgi:hypothetical protein
MGTNMNTDSDADLGKALEIVRSIEKSVRYMEHDL